MYLHYITHVEGSSSYWERQSKQEVLISLILVLMRGSVWHSDHDTDICEVMRIIEKPPYTSGKAQIQHARCTGSRMKHSSPHFTHKSLHRLKCCFWTSPSVILQKEPSPCLSRLITMPRTATDSAFPCHPLSCSLSVRATPPPSTWPWAVRSLQGSCGAHEYREWRINSGEYKAQRCRVLSAIIKE